MKKLLLAVLALSLVALAASRASAPALTVVPTGTERIDLAPTIKALVVSSPSPGKYSSRVGLVHAFSDAIIIVCFEWKNNVVAQCLVIANDGDTLMIPVRLLEEKT